MNKKPYPLGGDLRRLQEIRREVKSVQSEYWLRMRGGVLNSREKGSDKKEETAVGGNKGITGTKRNGNVWSVEVAEMASLGKWAK